MPKKGPFPLPSFSHLNNQNHSHFHRGFDYPIPGIPFTINIYDHRAPLPYSQHNFLPSMSLPFNPQNTIHSFNRFLPLQWKNQPKRESRKTIICDFWTQRELKFPWIQASTMAIQCYDSIVEPHKNSITYPQFQDPWLEQVPPTAGSGAVPPRRWTPNSPPTPAHRMVRAWVQF